MARLFEGNPSKSPATCLNQIWSPQIPFHEQVECHPGWKLLFTSSNLTVNLSALSVPGLRKKKSTGENGFRVSAGGCQKKKATGPPATSFSTGSTPAELKLRTFKNFENLRISIEKKLEAVNGEFCLKNPVKKHQFDTQTRCYLNIPRLFRS